MRKSAWDLRPIICESLSGVTTCAGPRFVWAGAMFLSLREVGATVEAGFRGGGGAQKPEGAAAG